MTITTQKKGRGRISQLDGKECFLAWVETGSLSGASDFLTEKGKVNTFTGKPFTPFGIRNAATRWVLYNHEEAKQHYINAGFEGDDKEWEEFLVRRATNILVPSSKQRFMDWIKDNNFEKYEYIYARFVDIETIKALQLPLSHLS